MSEEAAICHSVLMLCDDIIRSSVTVNDMLVRIIYSNVCYIKCACLSVTMAIMSVLVLNINPSLTHSMPSRTASTSIRTTANTTLISSIGIPQYSTPSTVTPQGSPGGQGSCLSLPSFSAFTLSSQLSIGPTSTP